MEYAMSEQSTVAPATGNEFLNGLMERLKGVMAFLEREEIIRFLNAFTDSVRAEIVKAEKAGERQAALQGRIASTGLFEELHAIHADLNSLEMENFIRVQSVSALHQSCTEYRDLLVRRVLDLVQQELSGLGKEPPVPFALVSMGSDGRGEQTLITDQDHLIVYGDEGGQEADDYFREFADLLVERLAEIGCKKCTGDIMPSNPTWRGSYSQWRKKLLA